MRGCRPPRKAIPPAEHKRRSAVFSAQHPDDLHHTTAGVRPRGWAITPWAATRRSVVRPVSGECSTAARKKGRMARRDKLTRREASLPLIAAPAATYSSSGAQRATSARRSRPSVKQTLSRTLFRRSGRPLGAADRSGFQTPEEPRPGDRATISNPDCRPYRNLEAPRRSVTGFTV